MVTTIASGGVAIYASHVSSLELRDADRRRLTTGSRACSATVADMLAICGAMSGLREGRRIEREGRSARERDCGGADAGMRPGVRSSAEAGGDGGIRTLDTP